MVGVQLLMFFASIQFTQHILVHYLSFDNAFLYILNDIYTQSYLQHLNILLHWNMAHNRMEILKDKNNKVS